MATDNPGEEKDIYSAYTRIIWDFKSHPMPYDVSPFSIYKDIKEALEKKGYHGWSELWAYGDEKLDEDMEELFIEAAIVYVPQRNDDNTVVNKMVKDMLSCAAVFRYKPNLVVISKTRTEDMELDRALSCLTARGYNVISVNPDEDGTEMPFLSAETYDASVQEYYYGDMEDMEADYDTTEVSDCGDEA